MWISGISCQVIVSSEIIGRGRRTGTDYRDVSSFGLESHDDHHPSVLSQGNAHRGHSRKEIWHLLRVVAIIFSLFISLSFFTCLCVCAVCIGVVHVYVETRNWRMMSSLIVLHFIYQIRVFCWNLLSLIQLVQTSTLPQCPYFCLLSIEIIGNPPHLLGIFMWLLETHTLVLKFMCFTHWVILPGPVSPFSIWYSDLPW